MATINDKFSKASSDSHYAVATTVAALRATNAKVLQCADVSSFPQSTVAHFVTYKKQYNPIDGTTAITNKAAWMGVANKDNNTITDLTIAPGYSDWGNAVGDVVECIPTSFWANNLVDGLLVQHDERGYLKNKSVTLVNINGGSTPGILQTDASGVVSSGKVSSKYFEMEKREFALELGIGGIAIQLFRQGNIVTAIIAGTSTSPTAGETVVPNKLPDGYKTPSGVVISLVYVTVNNGGTPGHGLIRFYSDGGIRHVSSRAGLDERYGTVSWFTNDPMPGA
jgi:hypothetical protein